MSLLACLFLAVAVLSTAHAADRPLSLQDAVKLALENNPQITEAELGERIAEIQAQRARLDRFTVRLSTAAAYDLSAGKGKDAEAAGHALAYGVTSTLGVPVYSGGRVAATIDAADRRLDIAQIDRTTAGRQLERAVYRRYWTLLGLEAQIAATREGLAVTEQALDIMHGRNNAGLTAGLDVNRSTVSLLSLKAERVVEQGELAAAQQGLLQLLHLEGDSVVLADSLGQAHFPNWPTTPDSLVEQAYGRRPELLRLAALHAQAEAQRRVLQSATLPQLSLEATAGPDGLAAAAFGGDTVDTGTIAPTVTATVGARVAWNPFDLLRVRDDVRVQTLALAQIEASQASERDQIRQEVRSSFSRVLALRERSQVVQQQVDLARDNLGIIQDLFAQGSMSILELFDAQSAFRQATSAQAAQQVDRVIAEYDLRWAIGESIVGDSP